MPQLTPSQTIGPFYFGTIIKGYHQDLAPPGVAGERVEIALTLHDTQGAIVPDGLFEIWQANSHGRYRHPADTRRAPALDPNFTGFGRSGTDDAGRYWFETIRPGAVPFDDARVQAPHLCVMVFARGLLNHLVTRLYFADEPANETDPVLGRVPCERRGTLMARPETVDGRTLYRWDIILQGAGETAFFNL